MDRRVERREARSGRKTAAAGVGEAHRGGPLAVEMRSRDLGSIPAHLAFPIKYLITHHTHLIASQVISGHLSRLSKHGVLAVEMRRPAEQHGEGGAAAVRVRPNLG